MKIKSVTNEPHETAFENFLDPLSSGMLYYNVYLWNGLMVSRYKEMLKSEREGAPLSSSMSAEIVRVYSVAAPAGQSR